ncbi:circularly permuted type 2 ATP-grasp protein [uncultured Thiohalocapsa sp.]|uniref:circularly permuted type 2 ATP-grasp protein n=1 Tax=uncultured Thiohalocapsa sp. TaxID=768990 RepID=UPI0025E5BC72|nr:circularly permuted type 2 ATP-grasp protein [uncultured Thiohalocapsa sp.]
MSATSPIAQLDDVRLEDAYVPAPGTCDEMRAADGGLRPHWQYLIDTLRQLGRGGIETRWREAHRLIRDNGVTYNLHGDPRSMSRPWELDPLPLLLRGEEWAELERGLIQRAELLNAVLLDLYGPRRLITQGLLPPELVDGYAGYLLPCHGISVAGDRPLVFYGADLTRDADGHWRVIGDRTQTPSGAGYALENRVVLSRVMPSLFRDSHVHRLAGFFRGLRRTMNRLAPGDATQAQVALMTPGPANAAYFEHAYLANYLGYTLVQGADLSVRDGALWLRTLGRLERIDAVLRRVDDCFCDPLELREDSMLGVPGMVQAVRTGNLTVANALGSGVLEHPGLMAFLPALCRQLLGEDLLLPHLHTWWCGCPQDRAYVLDNLDALVIKPAGSRTLGAAASPPGPRVLFPRNLDADARARLVAQIQAQPHRFVAQEEVKPSTAPVYMDGRIVPRPFVLRSFSVAEEDGYAVMPGGLSRVALSEDTPMVSSQLGGLGKDTWVLATEPEREETLLGIQESQSPAVVRESDVSSRIADNLFWIGRYAERAEGLVRLLRVTAINLTARSSFAAEDQGIGCLGTLLEALNEQCHGNVPLPTDAEPAALAAPTPQLLSLITDLERVGALPQTLQALGLAAWSVRERLSSDTWRVINDIERHLRRLTSQPPQTLNAALYVLDPLVTALVAFSALTQENMTHNEGWHFLEAGRRLERGMNLATLLRSTLVAIIPAPEDGLVVEAVLGVTDSLITYRRRYQAGTRVGALLDLVVQDEANPRSLAYQILRLSQLLEDMPRDPMGPARSAAQKGVLRLLTELRLAGLDQLAQPDADGLRRGALAQFLTDQELGMAEISDALTAQYFRHEEHPHHMIEHRLSAVQR